MSAYEGIVDSCYQFINDLNQPSQPMNVRDALCKDRPAHRELLYSLQVLGGFFNIPQVLMRALGGKTGPTGFIFLIQADESKPANNYFLQACNRSGQGKGLT